MDSSVFARLLRSSLAGSVVIVGAACAASDASPAGGEDIGETSAAITYDGITDGNWSGMATGQCTHGVHTWYLAHYNINLPGACVSEANKGVCAKCGACQDYVYSGSEPPSSKFTKYAWGKVKPQLYDIVVFKPHPSASTAHPGPGHIAIVDHYKASKFDDVNQMFVMDTNYVGPDEKAKEPHTVPEAPYGLFRLKSLDKTLCNDAKDDFSFYCDGEKKGDCVQISESAAAKVWKNDYFCSAHDLGMKWSNAGAVAGLDCTNVTNPGGAEATAWVDNFLCVAPEAPYAFTWATSGEPKGDTCVRWEEPSDKGWKDNYMCFTEVHTFTAGAFSFSEKGPIDGKTCVNVAQKGETQASVWADNFFCSDTDIGMKWSTTGAIDGMTCTNVPVAADTKNAKVWADSYVCLPEDAPYALTWSFKGPVAGEDCVRWFDHAETSSIWWDTWMCATPRDETGEGGSGGEGGSAGAHAAGSGGHVAGAGGHSAGAGGASGHAGGAGTIAGSGGAKAAGSATTTRAGSGGEHESEGTPLDASSDSGGCATSGRGNDGDGAIALGALAALGASRRRRRG